MRRLLAGLAGAVAVAVVASPLLAQDPAPPTPTQQTSSSGTLPLEGRWLAIVRLGSAEGVGRSAASLWEITRRDGTIELVERLVALPPEQRAKLQAGGWQPSAGDLSAIAAAWDSLAPEPRGVARIDHRLYGADGFDDDVRAEPMTAGARWVVRQAYTFAPGGSRPMKEVRLFAAETEDRDGYGGTYLSVTVAMAPLPIPIKIPGTFRLLRLPDARPLWTRIADVFRGCNGRRSTPSAD
jgi:hypothetical protein